MDLLKKRYFQQGEEEWDDIAGRVAVAIADAEEKEGDKAYWMQEFYDIISSLDFIPSTPCLINADVENPGQLSSCFTIDLKDNIESIYNAKTECAKVFQRNGGIGFNLSVLRPANSKVHTSGGRAGGPIGFMDEFNITADVVTRNNVRKGKQLPLA